MTTPRDRLAAAKTLYATFLKRNKMLWTKERSALLEFIMDQRGHFSADELLFAIQRAGIKVSRATAYRALNQLVETGILSESDFGHGHTHYEIDLGSKPHVHLICKESGEVKEVASAKLEAAIRELAGREDFAIQRFKIQVFGRFNRARGKK